MKFFISNKISIIIAFIGAAIGFSYWYFIGCATGNCGITANWYSSIGFGAIMGWLVGDIAKKKIFKNKIMKNLLLVLALAVSFSAISCSTQNNEKEQTEQNLQNTKHINKNVKVNEFATLIGTDNGQILDVRTPEEWAEGTIKGAIKINFYDDNFNAELSKLDKTKPVYVYCKSGGRSAKAASQLDKMGFAKIYNLVGGMSAWSDAGKATVK